MTDRKQRVEFFLYGDALGLDIIGPLDVFTIATECLAHTGAGDQGYQTFFSGDQAGPVRLNSGLCLMAQAPVGEGEPPDIFIVPGGREPVRLAQDKDLVGRIRQQALKAKTIVSICNGAFVLAACGLLDQKKVTTHWLAAEQLARDFPKIDVCPDKIFIRDGNIWTSAGVTAGIDLALSVVEADHGPAIAMRVARLLVLYLHRSGGQSQFSEPMRLRARAGGQFIKLHDWILKHLDKPLSVEELADVAGMSPRNFSRTFAKTTGIPPGRYVELMRLNRARELLESSDASIKEVALAAGFMREERLRRAFTRHLTLGPLQYRVHFRVI
jgi:transcriptional regulator GlxA family with amidase domain